MAARTLTGFVFGLMVTATSCGGPPSIPVAHPSPSPQEDCRGATESANGFQNPSPTIQYTNLTVDGKLRDYRVFRPPALDTTKPVPLAIVLHGAPIDATGFEAIIHFDDEAKTAGFLAVYPNGCNGSWPYADGGPKVADLDFINKMLDRVERDFRIDHARVFVVGASAGAVMSYRLACDLSSRIAAMASVSGSMLADECHPTRPVSILEMHGTDDSVLPWQGGGPHPSSPVDTVIERWRTQDGCVGDPINSQTGITNTSLWSHCNAGTTVRLDTVEGGHHNWFGSNLDPVPGEPNANAVIWSFFSGLPARS